MSKSFDMMKERIARLLPPPPLDADTDVGSSSYLSPHFYVGTRLGCALFLCAAGCVAILKGGMTPSLDWRPWAALVLAASFALLTHATFQVGFHRAPSYAALHVAPPLHFVACVLACAVVTYKTNNDWGEPARFLPLALVLFDFALGCKVRFRARYVALPPLSVLPYTLQCVLSAGVVRAEVILDALRLLAIGLVVFALSRVQDYKQSPSGAQYDQIA